MSNKETQGQSLDSEEIKINSQVWSVVKTVFDRCKKESDSYGLVVPLDDHEERVSYYTGFPKDCIKKLHNAHSDLENKCIDDFCRYVVLQCLRDFYCNLSAPNFKDLYNIVKARVTVVPDLEDFKRELSLMGFGYRRVLKVGHVLMEDPKRTFERYHYLNKIKKIRNENTRNIYYIDERIIDKTLMFKKPWIYGIDVSSVMYDKYVLLFMISKNGYENGLFCCQLTTEDFNKWVVDIFLPILKPSSVIVMDNSPVHGELKKQTITRYHSKEEMLEWLMENNVPCNPKMRKPDLYNLIDRYSIRESNEQFDIDQILKAYGHDVLRLPSSFYDLSPTEMLWRYIKTNGLVKNENIESLVTLKKNITDILQNFPKDKWFEFEKVIQNKECDIFSVDEDIEKYLERYYKIEETDCFRY